jgi:hypothetical protein
VCGGIFVTKFQGHVDQSVEVFANQKKTANMSTKKRTAPKRQITWTIEEDDAILKNVSKFTKGNSKNWMGLVKFLHANNLVTADKTNTDLKNR